MHEVSIVQTNRSSLSQDVFFSKLAFSSTMQVLPRSTDRRCWVGSALIGATPIRWIRDLSGPQRWIILERVAVFSWRRELWSQCLFCIYHEPLGAAALPAIPYRILLPNLCRYYHSRHWTPPWFTCVFFIKYSQLCERAPGSGKFNAL